MKLHILIPVLFLMCIRIVHAQDLIVKDNGDSLNCKIIYIESDFIHFSFKYENEFRATMLPLGQVKFYKKHFYATSEVAPDKNVKGNYQKLRLALFGGWSYETAKVSGTVPYSLKDYVKELKSGYHFGVSGTYFISEYFGFGLKYSNFNTKNEIDRISIVDPLTGQTYSGRLADDISIQFIAPSFTTWISSADKKSHFVTDLALGYLSYRDRATVINNFILTGGTLGFQLGFGVDFTIAKNLSLGFGVSYLIGALTQYNIDDGVQKTTVKLEEDNLESLNRFDISLGLRWSE